MSDQLQVACLGAGYFSQFQHDAWQRNPRTHLLACADHDVEKAKSVVPDNAFTSLQDMLSNTNPDVLDIITPPDTHSAAIEEAVKYKLKAIICQKPFCQSLSEAQKAIALAADASIPLVIHENFRFQPWYRCMKNAIDKGMIGNVLQFTFRLRTGDGQGVNAYLDRQPYFRQMPRLLVHETAVHLIDTTHYLLGEADNVYADLRTLNPGICGEDAGYIVLGYNNGKRALFDGNRLLDHQAENTRLTFGEALLEGDEGTISLTGDGQVELRSFAQRDTTVLLPAKPWHGFAGDCVYALQDHVVGALLDNTTLENTAQEYMTILNMVENVYESDKLGRRLSCSPKGID